MLKIVISEETRWEWYDWLHNNKSIFSFILIEKDIQSNNRLAKSNIPRDNIMMFLNALEIKLFRRSQTEQSKLGGVWVFLDQNIS